MNKKYLIIVTVAVVLIGIGSYCLVKYAQAPGQENGNVVSGITSTTTSSVTSRIGMKLYRNEQYGFEFWYPERWLMENKTSYAPRNQLYLSVNLPNDYTLTMDSFSVSIVNPNLAASFKQGESTSTIVVANSLGETYQSALEGVSSIVVDLPINKQRLLFIVQKQHETEFKDILATLKFLK